MGYLQPFISFPSSQKIIHTTKCYQMSEKKKMKWKFDILILEEYKSDIDP